MVLNATSGVAFQRQEVVDAKKKYTIISDAIDGQDAVKAKKADYLPLPDECKSVADNRYIAYLTRALYYNVCQPTRDALVGQLFLRNPKFDKVPEQLEKLFENINGEGLNITQLIKQAANYLVPFGRAGLLVDFPTRDGQTSVADIESGKFRPTIRAVEPWSIRNWHTERVGNEQVIKLLVVDEKYEKQNDQDEFVRESSIRQRVYRLKDDKCTLQIYEEERSTGPPIEIKGAKGSPLKRIPFEFIGSENNDADIDVPPFENIANLNIAHFRNSADYEESVFLCGQPTLACSGLTEEWAELYFKQGIKMGSRTAIPLPENGKAELLQADANKLAFEAMQHKEDQMISIGAKIIQPKSTVERKEAEIEIEAASQTSILKNIRDNLQMAITASLMRMAEFLGVPTEGMDIELNDNFDLTSMTADELRSLLEVYNGNGISFSEYRENLRRSGLAKLSVDDAKKEILADAEFKKSLLPPEPEPTAKPPVKKPAA